MREHTKKPRVGLGRARGSAAIPAAFWLFSFFLLFFVCRAQQRDKIA
jgi:hypothetical protein